MILKQLGSRRQDSAAKNTRHIGWRHAYFHSLADGCRVVTRLIAAVANEGFAVPDLFAIRLSLEEAIVNAIKHGHQGDQSKCVRVSYQLQPAHTGNPAFRPATLVIKVEDQGAGFDPRQVVDPTAPENLHRPNGRGLMLMREFMTSVCFNRRGNCVTMCKECSPESPQTTGYGYRA